MMAFERISNVLSTVARAPIARRGIHYPQTSLSLRSTDISKGCRASSTTAGVFPLSGVEAVLSGTAPHHQTIFDEYGLPARVAVVTGGNRGLGLEMSLALSELGARVYALDLPEKPSDDFLQVREHVSKLGGGRSLEYVSVNVTDQKAIWNIVEDSEYASTRCEELAGMRVIHTGKDNSFETLDSWRW